MALYLDLHVLQSVPFANLNRDELGIPKTVRYGDTDRTRVSSQAWKREIRHEVEEQLGEYAKRTRLVPAKVAAALTAEGWPEDLAAFAGEEVARSAGKDGLKVEDGHTSVLLYLPQQAINDLAAECAQHREALEKAFASAAKGKAGKKKPQAVLPTGRIAELLKGRTASIDLFGRMLAELPGGKVDGAVQVAHAFTTSGTDPQPDFFTAVDDWLPAEQTGSGHMQTAEYSAGVFYRFATVNVEDLLANIGGDMERARHLLTLFADAFVMSLPQAKKNSTAPHTIPDLVYGAVRSRRPISLAPAFEKPVRGGSQGLAAPSRKALAAYAEDVERLTGGKGRLAHGHAGVDETASEALGPQHTSYPELIETLVTQALAAKAAA
ncbi:type I-E CRISPR-associated protein Cas7/Cse4/CasC [Streptomyces albus]|uniref:Type I-E CRISPR-associated protein Cas7/Cse4/CasC n=1 Tax=Streptomyces albus TaxID=1888 RepID=A0A8H1L6S4_9ACTN|nr:type I-E CRISPR-associated protein Cas7/Cse4/CasC [Streptomyces albus]TGG78469.1 type I-E CRISPR-associated protein Cas7/Cse4/CasC [Streptomyces albus]UVN59450.1 type I-E CRISPR-associated protein Cas7/Cse4/CasC [Streptomyces albus]